MLSLSKVISIWKARDSKSLIPNLEEITLFTWFSFCFEGLNESTETCISLKVSNEFWVANSFCSFLKRVNFKSRLMLHLFSRPSRWEGKQMETSLKNANTFFTDAQGSSCSPIIDWDTPSVPKPLAFDCIPRKSSYHNSRHVLPWAHSKGIRRELVRLLRNCDFTKRTSVYIFKIAWLL